MGLATIRINGNLRTHPKTLELAARIGDPQAWRWPVSLWLWAIENRPSGSILGSDPLRTVEMAVGWTGKPGELGAAFVECRWLDQGEDGALYIHKWAEYSGKDLERARKEAERQRNRRQSEKGESVLRTYGVRTADVQQASAYAAVRSPQLVRSRSRSVLTNQLTKDLWAFIQGERESLRLRPETALPPRLQTLIEAHAVEIGIEGFKQLWTWFSEDQAFAKKGWASNVFVTTEVFERRLDRWRAERAAKAPHLAQERKACCVHGCPRPGEAGAPGNDARGLKPEFICYECLGEWLSSGGTPDAKDFGYANFEAWRDSNSVLRTSDVRT